MARKDEYKTERATFLDVIDAQSELLKRIWRYKDKNIFLKSDSDVVDFFTLCARALIGCGNKIEVQLTDSKKPGNSCNAGLLPPFLFSVGDNRKAEMEVKDHIFSMSDIWEGIRKAIFGAFHEAQRFAFTHSGEIISESGGNPYSALEKLTQGSNEQ